MSTETEQGPPPGVHPSDRSSVIVPGAHPDANTAAPGDTSGDRFNRGRAPWKVENSEALGVFQRQAHDMALKVIVVNAAGTSGSSGTVQVVGRQAGRTLLALWVPATIVVGGTLLSPTTAGVMISDVEGELQEGGGIILNVGDSLPIYSEGPVWAGVIPGQSTGYLQMANFFNPPGGALGGA